MERLTGRNEAGQAYYKKCFEEPCQGMPEDCALCDYHNETVCERLAAYEDTGLTPEKIYEIDKAYAEICKELAEYKRLNKEIREKAIEEFAERLKTDTMAKTFGLRICDIDRIAEQMKGGGTA